MKRVGFDRHERVRLWLSYQRYALLLSSVSLGMIAGVIALGSAWTWGWTALVIVVPLTINFGRFSVEVFGSHPRKLRATWAHQRRIDSQRFAPTAVRSYCGDPCWRVVADEVLTRAGLPATERRALIREFRREVEDDAHATVVVDYRTGAVHRSSDRGESFSFRQPPQRIPSALEPAATSPHFEPGHTS